MSFFFWARSVINRKCSKVGGSDFQRQTTCTRPKSALGYSSKCIKPGASFMCLSVAGLRFVFWLFLHWSSVYSYPGPGSVRLWLFRCFMHYIGLRPDWLALVVSGVFCVPTLHWKLIGLCLYFVYAFSSCIGSGSSWFVGAFFPAFLSCIGSGSSWFVFFVFLSWFVGVCVKPSSRSTSAGRDTAHRVCTYCWQCMWWYK